MTAAKVTLMIVGAHAGDAENMAGAIAAKYAMEGHRVVLVHMTLGERGNPKLSDQDYARQKRDEALKVAAALGCEVEFLGYRDGELPDAEEPRRDLVNFVLKYRPNIVITHWRGSFHRDHNLTSKIVEDALFYSSIRGLNGGNPPHHVGALYYAENWEDEVGYRPQILVDVSDAFDKWREAIVNYAFTTGATGFNYVEYYSCLMRLHGLRMGRRYAVALMKPEYHTYFGFDQIPL
jgi:LmbE family N-acetylglucosaminyl deacetylase